MTPRWLVLLALASPVTAADPRADPDGMPLPDGCLARLGSTRFRVWEKLNGPWFTPAGEFLFTEDEGEAVHFRFMDARTGLFVRKEKLHDSQLAGNGSIQSVLGMSDDGRTYAVFAAEARTQRVHVVTWDIAAGKVSARIPFDVKSGVPPFSDNLRWFAHFDRDTGDVTVTDARTGQTRRVTRIDPESRPELFPAPDGKSVVIATDSAVTVFAVPTGDLVREVVRGKEGQSLSGVRVRYAADGRTVLIQETGKDDGGLWRCDVRTGTTTRLEEKSGKFFVASVSPDGSRAVLGGREGQGDRLVHFADNRRVEIPSSSRRQVPFSVAGDRFVTLGADGITVQDADTGKPLFPLADPLPSALQFHDGGRTVIGFGDNTVTLWDTATGRRVNRFNRPAEWRGLPFAGGRKVFAEVAPGDFVLTDPLTGRRDATNWRFLANARAWQPTPCGRFVVAIFSNDGQTRVQKFAVSSGEVVAELHGLPIRLASGNMAMTPDGQRIAIAGVRDRPLDVRAQSSGIADTAFVVVCELETEKTVYNRRHRLLGNLFSPLALGGNGSRLLVLSAERERGDEWFDSKPVPFGSSGILDPKTGLSFADMPTGESTVTTAVSADGRVFACGWDSGRVELYEAATGGLRATFRHKDAVTALAFSPDGTKLAAASNDAPAYLWDVRGTLRNLPKTFDPASGDALWAALANPDAVKSFDAMQRLAAAPADTVKLFARQQPPAVVPAPDWVAARRTKLESREFAVRERATVELTAVAEMLQPSLTEARKWTTSPEAQRRLAKALAAIGSNSPERLRVLRSVEVLEWVRTPAARELLRAWAAGAARAPLTVAAGQSLRR